MQHRRAHIIVSNMALKEYKRKRNFKVTKEPAGKVGKKRKENLLYVIHQHAASRLHYDLRLELDGTLKSWAVPKGPSLDPQQKRLAVHVEDHPLEYGPFEGVIPEGEYGAGAVILWDTGSWAAIGDAATDYKKGTLKFELYGKKLKGRWVLVRTRFGGEDNNWLLIKEKDKYATSEFDILEKKPRSVKSKKLIDEIGSESVRIKTRKKLIKRA